MHVVVPEAGLELPRTGSHGWYLHLPPALVQIQLGPKTYYYLFFSVLLVFPYSAQIL